MISADVSARLKALRFPLIVGVVFIHAYSGFRSTSYGTAGVSWMVSFIRELISQGVAPLAVPAFFLISGFLFFQNYNGSLADYRSKLRRRLYTLLVPYLLWNTFTLAVLLLGQALPATRVFFANQRLGTLHLFSYLDTVLGLTTKYPICYQFWFLRDLMALQLLAPLFFLVLRRKPLALTLLLLAGAAWLAGLWPLIWPSDQAFFFFALGSYLAIAQCDMTRLDDSHRLFALCFVPLLLARAVPNGLGRFTVDEKVVILLGLPVLWWSTKVALTHPRWRQWLFRLSASSFFVYAAHEPLLTICRKLVSRRFPAHTGLWDLGWFLAVPITLIAALVVISEQLSRHFPRLYAVCTGVESPQRGQVLGHKDGKRFLTAESKHPA